MFTASSDLRAPLRRASLHSVTALEIVQVDAFSERAFGGNPAAVCLLARERPAEWMQRVAAEMNLSETAFLVPEADGYRLRWFTPAVEVDLCGHATLASAHHLWEAGVLGATEAAVFHTRSGRLEARRQGEWIEMDFPLDRPRAADPAPGLAEALGARPTGELRSKLYRLVELESEAVVRGLEPDVGGIGRAAPEGLIVTARADGDEFDFVSRFFAPELGVDEDPVTGSAHCVLAPYWTERLGRDELVGYQASARGGVVRVRVMGDRVVLAGRAITVLRGELQPAAVT